MSGYSFPDTTKHYQDLVVKYIAEFEDSDLEALNKKIKETEAEYLALRDHPNKIRNSDCMLASSYVGALVALLGGGLGLSSVFTDAEQAMLYGTTAVATLGAFACAYIFKLKNNKLNAEQTEKLIQSQAMQTACSTINHYKSGKTSSTEIQYMEASWLKKSEQNLKEAHAEEQSK